MADNIEQEAINKLTSAGSALKDPFSNLENALMELSDLNKRKRQDKNYQQLSLASIPKSRRSYSENLKKVLFELGEMFKVCRTCGNRTLNDELIKGICFDCHIKSEQFKDESEDTIGNKRETDLDPLTARIGKLEAQVKAIKTGYQAPRVYMSDIKAEILSTLRKDIRTEINSMKDSISAPQNTNFPQNPPSSPPPPPPSFKSDQQVSSSIDFSEMTIEELKTFSPDFLESLPIIKRNQYNDRLKELRLIEKMTSKQREKYFDKKRREKEQIAKLNDLKDSLMNLDELENSLFLKMKKKAEKATISGKGTLGIIDSKIVYIFCHNCHKTNEVTEGEDIRCKFCKEPLDLR